jgi:protein SCO1/2
VVPLLFVLLATGCTRQGPERREFQLKGQILSLGRELPNGWREVSVKHEDIPGFMPAMTMPYYVRDRKQLDGVAPGDLVSATLVLIGSEPYLDRVHKTGHAELPADAKAVKIMDVMAPGDEVPGDELRDQEGRRRSLSGAGLLSPHGPALCRRAEGHRRRAGAARSRPPRLD